MIVNGGFDDVGGWSLVGEAEITGAYGFYPGSPPSACALRSSYGFAPAPGEASQAFAVVDGEVMRGQLMLESGTAVVPTMFEVTYDGVLKYSIDSGSMVAGVWVGFAVPFDAADEAVGAGGQLSLELVQTQPPGIYSGYHRFLVDALTQETSMIAQSLMEWIDAEGFGTEGTDLWLAHMPESPDDLVVVYDESAPGIAASQAYGIDVFGVKVAVRADSYADARDKSIDIHKRLAGFSGLLVVGSPKVIMVDILQAPTSMGRDAEGKRAIWTARYALQVVSTGDQFRS